MPPSAVLSEYQSPSPLCCGAFDIGEIEIEVQAIDGVKSTQIVVAPGNNYVVNIDELAQLAGVEPHSLTGCHDYVGVRSEQQSLDRCLADSFDSTDEIIEGSNEMKLMKRVVDKQRANSKNAYGREVQQNAEIQRQDSMSDTNSVNSNDVFVSIEDSKEIEFLDIVDFQNRNEEAEELYPNKQKYQANLDQIIEHLCVAPCGECLPVDTIIDEQRRAGEYPKSVLRKPRYSSPDMYSSINRDTKEGIYAQMRSLSNDNTGDKSNNIEQKHSVRFQNVDIRNFKMTLGNHPSATTGPPVMLDGELIEPNHLARKIMTIEKYEQTRPPRRKRRQLKLTLQQRHNILVKERGFSFEEVKGAWQESLQIRRQRKETLDRGLAMMKWDEVWESTCRKFNRLVDVKY